MTQESILNRIDQLKAYKQAAKDSLDDCPEYRRIDIYLTISGYTEKIKALATRLDEMAEMEAIERAGI